MLKSLFLFTVFSIRVFAIDSASVHLIEAMPKRDIGAEVYNKYCAICHKKGSNKLELMDKKRVQKYSIKELIAKISKKGCKNNSNSPYKALKMYEVIKVIRYIKKEVQK